MGQYNPNSYDDMAPSSSVQEEDRKFRTIKRMITAVTALLILAALGAVGYIIWEMQSGNDPEMVPAAKSVTESLQEADQKLLEMIIDEPQPEGQMPSEAEPSGKAAEPQQPQVAEASPTPQEDTGSQTESGEPLASSQADQSPEQEQEPGDSEQETPQTTISNAPVSYTDYIVAEGDTVTRIAAAFGLEPETIIGVNSIANINEIRQGSTLRIPDRNGQLYIVKAGDTLSEIAYSFGMGYVTLADVNGLDSSLIRVGQRLFIPEKTISTESYRKVMNILFTSPVEGIVAHPFGSMIEDIITGEEHPLDGILYSARLGTEVRASDSGTVSGVYNDQSGLGRYIEIEHENGYVTRYGHLEKHFVSSGAFVTQGEVIGSVGNSGRVLEPVLYFQITKDGTAVDPQSFF